MYKTSTASLLVISLLVSGCMSGQLSGGSEQDAMELFSGQLTQNGSLLAAPPGCAGW